MAKGAMPDTPQVRTRQGPGESKSIRVSGVSHVILSQLSEQTHQPLQTIADAAIEHYRRHKLMEATNRAYATLRADVTAWADFQQEQEAWNDTLRDGVEAHPAGR
jgi:predicted transcriptional regulator